MSLRGLRGGEVPAAGGRGIFRMEALPPVFMLIGRHPEHLDQQIAVFTLGSEEEGIHGWRRSRFPAVRCFRRGRRSPEDYSQYHERPKGPFNARHHVSLLIAFLRCRPKWDIMYGSSVAIDVAFFCRFRKQPVHAIVLHQVQECLVMQGRKGPQEKKVAWTEAV